MRPLATLRERRRKSLRWKLRHANPRGLSRRDYRSAEELQARAISAALRDEDAPDDFEILRARAEQARQEHQEPPPLPREVEVAMLRADAIRQANSGW